MNCLKRLIPLLIPIALASISAQAGTKVFKNQTGKKAVVILVASDNQTEMALVPPGESATLDYQVTNVKALWVISHKLRRTAIPTGTATCPRRTSS